MGQPRTIYIDNDMQVRVPGLRDREGTYQDSANLEMTLLDGDENVITGPISLSYVSGSDGDYTATLEDTVDVERDARYWLHIEGSASGKDIDMWIPCIVRRRTE